MQRITRYDVSRMAGDVAAKGWQPIDLARKAGVAASTVTRFLRGEHQTPRMAKRLSKALGQAADHYLIRDAEAVA